MPRLNVDSLTIRDYCFGISQTFHRSDLEKGIFVGRKNTHNLPAFFEVLGDSSSLQEVSRTQLQIQIFESKSLLLKNLGKNFILLYNSEGRRIRGLFPESPDESEAYLNPSKNLVYVFIAGVSKGEFDRGGGERGYGPIEFNLYYSP